MGDLAEEGTATNPCEAAEELSGANGPDDTWSLMEKRTLNHVTKGSSRGATLSFTLRSKGEGGQPRYLILQEIASHFSTPPPSPHPPPPPPLHTSHAP